MRILVVEDEPAARDALERALRLHGYTVSLAGDGEEGLELVARETPDAVVLDVLMPGLDGVAACRRLRAGGDRTPVLMLTARDSVADRVAGLDAGADDYLVKPFALEELLARLRSLLRRAGGGDGPLSFSDVTLDPGAREVWRDGHPFELTRTEFNLLELFVRNPRQVLTRTLIFERVWGYDFGPTVQRPRGLRRVPPPQARGERWAAPHPHRARGRLPAPRAVTSSQRVNVVAGYAGNPGRPRIASSSSSSRAYSAAFGSSSTAFARCSSASSVRPASASAQARL